MSGTINTSIITNLTNSTAYRGPCNHILFDTEDKKLALIGGYFLVIILSIVGNTLITIIIYKNQSMRTATNILVVNMCVSDMIFSIFYIPVYIYSHFSTSAYWHIDGFFAAMFCKLYVYLNKVSISVSIFTMIAIAYDRFYAIVYPFKAKLRTGRSRIITIVLIWVLSGILYIHEFIRFETLVWKGKTFCVYTAKLYSPMFRWIFDNITFVLLFALPLIIMCILYGILIIRMQMRKLPGNQTDERQARENARNRRVVYMSVTVVVIFAFVISPFRVYELFGSPRVTRRWVQCWEQDLKLFVNFMMQSSCALNPFVYFAFSENYRQGLIKILCCRKVNRVGVVNNAVNNRPRNTHSTGAASKNRQPNR